MTLPTDVRQAVAQTTGQAPVSVPIRRGAAIAAEARALRADAFTRGGVIHAPGTAPLLSHDDRRLLAHEVTHLVQQARYGSALPAEGTSGGQALERQAMQSESAVSPSQGRIVPARRNAVRPALRAAQPSAASPPGVSSHSVSSAGATALPSANGPIRTSATRGAQGHSVAGSSVAGSSIAADEDEQAPKDPAAQAMRSASGEGSLGATGSEGSMPPPPVPARPVPATVPPSRDLSPRMSRAPQVHHLHDAHHTARPALPPAPLTTPAPTASAGIQRRASRSSTDATIGASTAAQEDSSDRPASAPGSGARTAVRPSVDTTRDQEWLMRHAQALYPLLRTMLRAELLRDHERRGHMLKENF
ncbi:MAG: DUF4157 domain-containing protein [Actinomycetales bacterium]|nr:DUF4157 domain-containing protein [Actinomycetales bacterium]